MTQIDDNEQINRKLWLPDGEPVITEHRAAKGDVLVERDDRDLITFAQLIANTALNHLHHTGTLTAQHVHEGGIYEVWQVCFRAELGYRNNPIYATEIPGMRRMLADERLDVGDFEKLIRALTLIEKQIIEFCLYTTATEHIRWLAERNAKHIRKAFDRMSEIMKRLRDEAAQRREESACA